MRVSLIFKVLSGKSKKNSQNMKFLRFGEKPPSVTPKSDRGLFPTLMRGQELRQLVKKAAFGATEKGPVSL